MCVWNFMWLHFNRRHARYLGFTICHGNCRRSSSSTVTVFDSQEQIRQRSEDTHVTADLSQIEGVHVRKAQKQAVLSLLSFTFACRLLLRRSLGLIHQGWRIGLICLLFILVHSHRVLSLMKYFSSCDCIPPSYLCCCAGVCSSAADTAVV